MENEEIQIPRYDGEFAGGREDAGETAFVAAQTNYLYLMQERKYRPLFFREILEIDRSIPPDIETYILRRIDGAAPGPVPFQFQGAKQQGKPEVKAFEQSKKIFEFVTGYDVFTREMQRAARFGIPLQDWRTSQIALACELFLDSMAATGDTFGLGLTGLSNLPDVSLVGSLTGGWAAATNAQVLADLWKIYFSVELNSKQISKCTDILIPQTTMQALVQKQSSTTDRTALEIFNIAMQDAGYQPPRIRSWQRLNTAGASSVTRAIAYDRTNPLGPRMIISQELANMGDPRAIRGGYTQDQSLVVGGVICPMPTCVAYADGV